jgi:hypothetical protein
MGGVCGKTSTKRKTATENPRPNISVQTNTVERGIFFLTLVRTNNQNQVVNSNHNIIENPVQDELINVSINDEISSRANTNRRQLTCNACRYSFQNSREFDIHFGYCGAIRTNNMMHNRLSEILQLVNSLNRHLQGDGTVSLLQMLGQEDPEEVVDYFDWEYSKTDNCETVWKKAGIINLNSNCLFNNRNRSPFDNQAKRETYDN